MIGPLALLAASLAGGSLLSTSTTAETRLELQLQVFGRVRVTVGRADSAEVDPQLTRARFEATLRYRDVLRITVEPDFAGAVCAAAGSVCDDADLSDVFLDVEPLEELEVRVGQAKVPFGAFEWASAWDMPSATRGLVNALMVRRLGFGGRRVGLKVRARLPELGLRPALELGGYTDVENGGDLDLAARAGIRLARGTRLELAGYARANATFDEGYGFAGAVAVDADRGPLFAIGELVVGRARRLSPLGAPAEDAVFLGARAIAAYAVEVGAGFELQPFLAIEGFDASAAVGGDLGGAARGGVNCLYERRLRVSVELGAQGGQAEFPAESAWTLTTFVGASLGTD